MNKTEENMTSETRFFESDVKNYSLPCSISCYKMADRSKTTHPSVKSLSSESSEVDVSIFKTIADIFRSNKLNRRRSSLSSRRKNSVTDSVSEDSSSEESRTGTSASEDQSPSQSIIFNDRYNSSELPSTKLYRSDKRKLLKINVTDCGRLDLMHFKSKTGFIDSCCHLDILFNLQKYGGTYANYMLNHKETYPLTYEGCVTMFCNPFTFHKKSHWQRYLDEDGVWGAFGCHPHNAMAYSDSMEAALKATLLHSKVRALGEIGLDYSDRTNCSQSTQRDVFRRQLIIALRRKLPLVIHCTHANNDCMRIMKKLLPKDYTIHMHSFIGNWDWAQKWLEEFPNLYIGISNLVTYKSSEFTHEVAQKIPMERLLLETDAPYFTPYFEPRLTIRSTRWSHPGMAIHVAAHIATLRNVSLEEIIFCTRHNTYKMYGI